MRLRAGTGQLYRFLGLLFVLLAVLALYPSVGNSQKKTLTKQDVIDLLTGDVPSAEVAEEAKKRGISFPITAAVEKEIRDAGGTEDLIRVLRSLSSPTPSGPSTPTQPIRTAPVTSPPVLLIESNPGGSQVYIDDEPVGTTSQEGRLKLTKLSAGDHRVRLSLSGYQDHEETVALKPGETATVTATLEPRAAPSAVPTSQPYTAPSLTNMPHAGLVSFPVMHDHNKGGSDYCVGVMSIGNGMIYYRSTNGMHTFDIPLGSVREAKRNAVYLVALRAFHIRLKKGTNYNFVAINRQGQYQPPDRVLSAIENAMGR